MKEMIKKLVCSSVAGLVFALVTVVFITSTPYARSHEQLSLTPAEKVWLQSLEGRPIRVAPIPQHPPYEFFNEKGEFVGIAADILKLVQEQLGFEVEIVPVSDGLELFSMLEEKSIDVIPGLTISPGRKKSMLFSDPFLSLRYTIVTRIGNNSIRSEEDLSGRKVALFQNQKTARTLLEKHPDIIPEYIHNGIEAMQAVATGKADATVLPQATALYLASRHVLTNLKIAGTIGWGDQPAALAVRKDWPEFTSLLNKALASLTEKQKNAIFYKWTNIKRGGSPSSLKLSNEELAWLAQHPVIRVGADDSRAPIEFFEDGKYKGLAVDYLKRIEQILDVRFEFVNKSWQELIILAREKKLDMFSCVAKTEEKERYLRFTEPYVTMSVGIFAGQDSVYVSDMDMLAGRKIAVVEGYAIHDYLVARYPELDLLLVETPSRGIRAVRQSDAFAFIDNSITTVYYLNQQGYTDIKLVGEIPFFNAQAMGVREDWPQLAVILQKALDTIPDAEKNKLYSQWVPLIYEKPVDYSLFWKIGGGILFIFSLVLLWNTRLKKTVHDRTTELERNKSYLRAIFNAPNEAIFVHDAHTGAVLDVNETMLQMFDCTYEEALNSTVSDFSSNKPPYTDEQAGEKIQLAVTTGPQTFEWQSRRKSGELFWAEVSLKLSHFNEQSFVIAVVRNIEAKKKAEKQLRMFKSFAESSLQGMGWVDTAGNIEYVNPALAALCGEKDLKASIGRKIGETYYADNEQARLKEEIFPAILKNGSWSGELMLSRTDGELIPTHNSLFLIGGEEPAATFFANIVTDLTEQKQAEKDRANLTEKLHIAQKMESIGMMAGGVAHDLNNILAGIVGYPELLLQNLPADSDLRKPIEAINQSGQRAAAVVADLLTVARGAASVRETHDLNDLIQAYLASPEFQQLKSQYPNINCNYNSDGEKCLVICSPVHVQKCIMNLVINGFEAITGVGTVYLSTFIRDIKEQPTVEQKLDGGQYVVVTVMDTGSGISDKDLTHIFEPFYSQKIMGKSGSGLGLSVVWNTMEDHGGKVFVESSEKGTCFQLYFPLVKGEAVTRKDSEDSEDYSGNNEHILVVDDEAPLRDIASQILTKTGYRTDAVSSGEEAIEFVRETAVDLLVLDMLMEPGINGFQTYNEIKKLYPDQKAIITSGFSENADVKAALDLGVGGFVKKPYAIRDLLKAVAEALKGHSK